MQNKLETDIQLYTLNSCGNFPLHLYLYYTIDIIESTTYIYAWDDKIRQELNLYGQTELFKKLFLYMCKRLKLRT